VAIAAKRLFSLFQHRRNPTVANSGEKELMSKSNREFQKSIKAGLKRYAQQQAAVEEASKHPIYDEQFGELTWAPHTKWLDGKTRDSQGREFRFSIEVEDDQDRRISVQTRDLFKRYLPQIEAIRIHAAEEQCRIEIELFRKVNFPVSRYLEVLVPHYLMIRANGDLEISYADPTYEVFSGGHQLTARYNQNGYSEVVLDG
jgi:hypothetical protein